MSLTAVPKDDPAAGRDEIRCTRPEPGCEPSLSLCGRCLRLSDLGPVDAGCADSCAGFRVAVCKRSGDTIRVCGPVRSARSWAVSMSSFGGAEQPVPQHAIPDAGQQVDQRSAQRVTGWIYRGVRVDGHVDQAGAAEHLPKLAGHVRVGAVALVDAGEVGLVQRDHPAGADQSGHLGDHLAGSGSAAEQQSGVGGVERPGAKAGASWVALQHGDPGQAVSGGHVPGRRDVLGLGVYAQHETARGDPLSQQGQFELAVRIAGRGVVGASSRSRARVQRLSRC